MYSIYFDVGTTNTRVYLLENFRLIDRAEQSIGAKDTAINKSNQLLKKTVSNLYSHILVKNHLTADDIAHICISGMASSPDGLRNIPHLETPVSLQKLRESLVPYYDADVLPSAAWIIPGVRTPTPKKEEITPEIAVNSQMVRGEETEIFGILGSNKSNTHQMIALPGSHTQIAFIKDDEIVDLFSCITGEIRNAILSDTILNSALSPQGPKHIDPYFALLGHQVQVNYGFNHALYGVRTLQLLSDASDQQRHSYFQGVLSSGVLTGLLYKARTIGVRPKNLLIAGRNTEFETFRTIAKEAAPDLVVEHHELKDIPFSVQGYIQIAQSNPILRLPSLSLQGN